MKKLNKTQSVIFLIGGLLMVIGTGCFVLLWHQEIACWVYFAGAVMFTAMQFMQIYEGNDLTMKRLKRIQNIGNICFLIAGMLMIDHVRHFLLPFFNNDEGTGLYNYQTYIMNKWVLLLLIAALLQMYTMHRMDYEMKKTKNNQ